MDELNTLIFRTDRIGDFIISCPFILSYKKKFKNNEITTISSEYNFDYIKNFNFIEKVIPLKNEIKFIPKVLILLKMILLLRKNSYKHIIILDGKNRSFFISLFLKGKKSILLQGKGLKFISKFFKYKSVFNYELQHQLKNFSFLASKLNFNINLNNINIYDNYKFQKKLRFNNKYILIHLDEKWFVKFHYKDFTDINPNKDQLERFVNKISSLTDNKIDIVISTGTTRLEVLYEFSSKFEKISDNLFVKNNITNKIYFINNSTFNDLESLVQSSSVLICCEGGVSHVSHNFQIKTLAFYEKSRLQHTKYWTGHMNKMTLYERKEMTDLIIDQNFFNILSTKINEL